MIEPNKLYFIQKLYFDKQPGSSVPHNKLVEELENLLKKTSFESLCFILQEEADRLGYEVDKKKAGHKKDSGRTT